MNTSQPVASGTESGVALGSGRRDAVRMGPRGGWWVALLAGSFLFPAAAQSGEPESEAWEILRGRIARAAAAGKPVDLYVSIAGRRYRVRVQAVQGDTVSVRVHGAGAMTVSFRWDEIAPRDRLHAAVQALAKDDHTGRLAALRACKKLGLRETGEKLLAQMLKQAGPPWQARARALWADGRSPANGSSARSDTAAEKPAEVKARPEINAIPEALQRRIEREEQDLQTLAYDPRDAVLPQKHPYQRTLRKYLQYVKEEDFRQPVQKFRVPSLTQTDDEKFRTWLLTRKLPVLGGVSTPAQAFTLKQIERNGTVFAPLGTKYNGINGLAWLATWDHPCNPYFGSAALKRRAFVAAAVDMIMLDDLHERKPKAVSSRSYFLGGTMIWLGYAYGRAKDVLPPSVRSAYTAGLRKFARRLEKWGPTGIIVNMDTKAPVGLWYAAQATGDPEIQRIAEAFSRKLLTENRYVRETGHTVETHGFDPSYQGIANYYFTWLAMISDWPFAREVLDRCYRLKLHLTLPEPDGRRYGPTHFATRTAADSAHDQWEHGFRNYGAAQVTEWGLPYVDIPDAAQLSGALARVVAALNRQQERAKQPQAWREAHWGKGLNYAYDAYRPGFYTRLKKLQRERSPKLRPVYLRPDSFVRRFAKDFVIVKHDRYAAIVHIGNVSLYRYKQGSPAGLGGGQLSAFWMPQTGSVLLGRIKGPRRPNNTKFANWRNWPVHAVSGETAAGKVVTSGRIKRPNVTENRGEDPAGEVVIVLEADLPKRCPVQGDLLRGRIHYARRFTITSEGVTVRTTVTGNNEDRFRSLYETLPVFLKEAREQRDAPPVRITLRQQDHWIDASPQPRDGVSAVRVHRWKGAIEITFSKPQRVRLSPDVWEQHFQGRAQCRSILIDLLGESSQPRTLDRAVVEYTIRPIASALQQPKP